jgi:hypothetical protein
MIGGAPYFMYESGIGDGITLPSGGEYFPSTGFDVADPFLSYVQSHGGFSVYGPPTGNPQALAGGAASQSFQDYSLRTHPPFSDTTYYMERVPAGQPFAAGTAYAPFAPVPPPAKSSTTYFPQTGHTVTGDFGSFFQTYGGLTIFGYPRTEAFMQDGRLVQWFQRAEFTETPGNGVQLALLGSLLTQGQTFAHPSLSTPVPTPTVTPMPTTTPGASPASRTPSPATSPTAAPTPPPIQFFPQTDYSVGFGFLHFFQKHGGVTVFGYPISQEMPVLQPDGQILTVQYFQRARFEYHPEFAGTPYEVELGLLGDQYLGL